MSLFEEIKRRNVFRAGAAYVVVAWLIIQVVETVLPPFGFSEAAIRTVVILLAIGFVPFVVFAWAFELTPEGLKPDSDVDYASPVFRRFEKKLNRLVMLLLALGLAYFAFDKFVLDPARDAEMLQTAGQQAAPTEIHTPPGKSIAILPFVDLSRSGDQEYLGDGIASQVRTELARMEGLNVASRRSSFSYRDRTVDVREIGESLDVSTVLEGSVQKDGDRIRVSAELVNVEDGYQLWSKTFERKLTDLFAIQDEIARDVAGALGVSLGVGGINSFIGAGTDKVEAYESYLQGIKLGLGEHSAERIRKFEYAVSIDPEYAAAWSDLGLTIGASMWRSAPEDAPSILDRAIPILERAVELEPDSANANSLLATVNYARFDWSRSEEHYRKSLELSPIGWFRGHYGNMLMRSGRSNEARSYYLAAKNAEWNSARTSWLWVNADLALQNYEEAKRHSRELDYPPFRTMTAYFIALNEGDPDAIKEAIGQLLPTNSAADELYQGVLREFDSREDSLQTLRAVFDKPDLKWPSKYHDIALLAAYFDDPEFALEVMSIESRLTTIRQGALWYPVMHRVRELPAFKELVTDINLVKYWREYGWSDHCRPLGSDDFECF